MVCLSVCGLMGEAWTAPPVPQIASLDPRPPPPVVPPWTPPPLPSPPPPSHQMATLDSAEGLLEELRAVAHSPAVQELQDVKDFAAAHGHEGELKWWDISFW